MARERIDLLFWLGVAVVAISFFVVVTVLLSVADDPALQSVGG
jgi:hypothetical protein